MASNRQKALGFVSKFGRFMRVRGRGLIRPYTSIDDRFKQMTLNGSGTPVHKQIDGGTIKQHQRPFDLKDSAIIPVKSARAYTPITFKL
jgi:hypothetical protein